MSDKPREKVPAPFGKKELPSVVDGLRRYLLEIRKFPILEPTEEYTLAKKWQQDHDPKAAEKLVASHLRLVAKIAHGYRGYGLPVGDLIAEGNIGLMQALKKFDPDKGFRFSTYAMWWVRANIQEYILHSWSLVKIGTTAAQKKLFFNLGRLREKLQTVDERSLSPQAIQSIATDLDVSEHDVIEMTKRMSGPDYSLNTPMAEEGGGEWQDWLEDEEANQGEKLIEREESKRHHLLLEKAMESLNEREQLIIRERRLQEKPVTLEILAKTLGVSRERVRQIEASAFNKLRKALKNAAVEQGLCEDEAFFS